MRYSDEHRAWRTLCCALRDSRPRLHRLTLMSVAAADVAIAPDHIMLIIRMVAAVQSCNFSTCKSAHFDDASRHRIQRPLTRRNPAAHRRTARAATLRTQRAPTR